MGAYEYSVVEENGREKKGTIEADTAKHARQKLREKGLMPLSVVELSQSDSSEKKGGFSYGGGMSAKDLSVITRQLATLIAAALPIEESIRTVAQQVEKQKIKRMLIAVRAKVMEGHALADGLAEFPRSFPSLFIATVRAGEQTGHLDTVLERLADYTENRQAIQQKITQAMIYPIVLCVIAVAVISGLLVFIVPKIANVFANQGQKLPDLTIFMMSASDFVIQYWYLIIGGVVTVTVLFMFAMTKEKFKYKFHQFLLRLPIIAKIVRGVNTGRFARTFSILTGSGVQILEGLKISSKVISNLPMRNAVVDATARIREGGGIGKSLEYSKQFPPMTINLISSGESSGKLEEMLDRAAVAQEREIESLIGTFLSLLEPLMIVGMGVIVMVIVMSVLLPIFQMNSMVG